MGLITIHVNDVLLEERQRKVFKEDSHKELVESIRDVGLLQAPVVREVEDRYILVAGERRLRALQEIILADEDAVIIHGQKEYKWGTIPALTIGNVESVEAAKAELDENIRRLDLSWQERTAALDMLHRLRVEETDGVQSYKATADEASKRGAKVSRNTISRATVAMEYLSEDELQKCKTADEAFKLAQRKMEETLLEKYSYLRARKAKMEEEQAEQESKTEEDLIFLLGDSAELLAARPEDEELFGVMLTDPPYGVNADAFGNAAEHKHAYEDTEEVALAAYANVFSIANRWMTADAHLYIFAPIHLWPMLVDLCHDYEWGYRRAPITWNKGSFGHLPSGGPSGYRRSSEFIFHAFRGHRAYQKVTEDVIYVNLLSQADRFHAAQKPDELYHKLLSMSCITGDRVLDPYAGTGTIFAAARGLHLKALGIEKNGETARMASARRGIELIEPEEKEDE